MTDDKYPIHLVNVGTREHPDFRVNREAAERLLDEILGEPRPSAEYTHIHDELWCANCVDHTYQERRYYTDGRRMDICPKCLTGTMWTEGELHDDSGTKP